MFGMRTKRVSSGATPQLQRMAVLKGLPSSREDHRHLGPLDERARDDVGVHGLAFDPLEEPPAS